MAFGQTETDAIFDAEFAALDDPYQTNLRALFKTFADGVNDELIAADLSESTRIALITQELQGFSKLLEGSLNEAGPILASAAVNGDTVTLTFEDDVQATPLPPTSIFTFDADSTDIAVSTVDSIVGAVVTLTLASAVTNGQTVVLETYDSTNDDSIQNSRGSKWTPTVPVAVTNNTP